jgi:hypothetical protein
MRSETCGINLWSRGGGETLPLFQEIIMATPKDIIKKLDEATKIALTFDSHLNQLINEVGRLLPTHNAMVVLLDKVGFGKEQQIEDNLKLLIDHHTSVVAENTILRKTITDRDALMEQLRRVVLGDVE